MFPRRRRDCLATPLLRLLPRKHALCRLERVAASSFDALAVRTKQERVPEMAFEPPLFNSRGADRRNERTPLSFLSLLRCLFRLFSPCSTSRSVLCDVLQLWRKRGGQGERCVDAQSCPRNDERALFCSTMAPSPFFFLPFFPRPPPLLQKKTRPSPFAPSPQRPRPRPPPPAATPSTGTPWPN